MALNMLKHEVIGMQQGAAAAITYQKAASTAQHVSLLQQAQLKAAAMNVGSAEVAGGTHT